MISQDLFQQSPFTINLSAFILTTDQVSLLDKGLSFIPSIKHTNLTSYHKNIDQLVRRLRLCEFFLNREDTYDPHAFQNRFLAPSSWCPPISTCTEETKVTISSILQASQDIIANNLNMLGDSLSVKCTSNLTANESNALRSLRTNADIIIKPADKGGSVVVMDKVLYEAEAFRQLNNSKYYKKIEQPLTEQNRLLINSLIDKLYYEKRISARQREFLVCTKTCKNRYFYLLPKVHKPRDKWPHRRMPEGRPIVASCGTELSNIGKFIDYFLQPLASISDYYIKDTYHFITRVRGKTINPHWLLVTGDVSSLYTNMDHDLIISTLKDFFRRFPDNQRPETELLQLMELTLKGNDFAFNQTFYQQILGMAMGNPCSPSTANLFLAKLDEKANSYTIATELYSRFLDDIFFLWPGTLEQFSDFERFINSVIPNINVTFNISDTSVNFLDVTFFKHFSNGVCTIETRPFFKKTDTHQLVHNKSFHPRHIFKGIIKSQFIRFKRLSSFKEDYSSACGILKGVLVNRGYSKRLMRKLQGEIWHNFKEKSALGNARTEQILPLVIKYDSVGTYSAKLWREILSKNPLFNNIKVITAYSVHHNLGDLLTGTDNRNKKIEHVRNPGCIRCTSTRCKACNIITETKKFNSTVTKKTFIIAHHISCTTENIVYLITCKACGLQYVGETGRMLKDRLNDHLSSLVRHSSEA